MSLLSPKELVISLAPGECRIEGDKLSSIQQFAIEGSDAIAASLQFLETQVADLSKKHRSLSLRLSDAFGVIQVLPWQEKLHKQIEIDRYGKICLDGSGFTNYDEWSIHADFLRYGENGIVYGFSNELIAKIQDMCGVHSLTLRQLIPKSAHAFFHAKHDRKHKVGYHCAIEPHRVSIMVYERSNLVSINVEPVVTTRREALIRIFNRLGIHHGIPQLLRIDYPSEVGIKDLTDIVSTQFSGAELQLVKKI